MHPPPADPASLQAPPPRSILHRILDHVFPKAPDFYRLLTEQAQQATHTVGLLVNFMETGDATVGKEIKRDEHVADTVKVRNLHALNEAFSTPFDREDIYRAIMDLDDVVNYCKTTVNEMDMLGIVPDAHSLAMANRLHEGVVALAEGFAHLSQGAEQAVACADAARKAERRVEKLYRHALAELFEGDDYRLMFKRREIYRHLSNAADRMAHCANTLHDIVVKLV